ncbi:hypothetical protein J3459_018436 [Metarhizium acridum]|nr:hypothetical protein J3459_018436 [Metarhizium acridum]
MYAIQHTAEDAVRGLLRDTLAKFGPEPLTATDYMDDGNAYRPQITIAASGSATFDFTGTDPRVLGNTNTPQSHHALRHHLLSPQSSQILYSLKPRLPRPHRHHYS